ncbi:hypothetical protein KUTeg_001979, partial [Tegillarca granosa]
KDNKYAAVIVLITCDVCQKTAKKSFIRTVTFKRCYVSGIKEVKWAIGPPPIDPKKTYINPEMEDQMTIEGYKLNKWKRACTYLAILITAGLLRLVFYWCPHWMLRCTHSKCPLSVAEAVLLQDQYKQWFVAKVNVIDQSGERVNPNQSPILKFRKKKPENTQNTDCTIGLSYTEQNKNISVWCSDEYYYYAACIFFISSVSIIITIVQTRKNQRALRNTIESSLVISVCRGNDIFEDISSEDLVPGDVIEIPRSGCVMQCDAVLISGNCIVNESMLTGESVPVTKTPLPNPKISMSGDSADIKFCTNEHSRHVLFSGTNIIQTRFQTAKGELVRSIVYPKPVDFKFEQDTYKFVGVLAAIAGVGFIYSIIQIGEDFRGIVLHSLDIITIAVPPALPAALAVGIVFAQRRLKCDGIYCISPRSINICGSINAVCFDKTGTLTEDGLMLQGVVPVNKGRFEEEITDLSELQDSSLMVSMATCHSLTIIDGKINGDPLDLIMFESTGWEPGAEQTRFDMMVPTVVRPGSRPDVIKSAYDMTELTNSFESSARNVSFNEIGIVRQFTFSSSLQRMSVICRKLSGQNFELYTKGSPEMIASLSQSDTVPDNFHEVLTQEQVEKDLIFLGLVVMENKLKPQTLPVIHQLLNANIRTVMITGDNMLTAISVARECGMVKPQDSVIMAEAFFPPNDNTQPQLEFVYADDMKKKVEEVTHEKDSMKIVIDESNPRFHFAVSGKSFAIIREHFPGVMSKIAVRGTVFARMAPDQKAQLVEILQKLGYYIGMCGDGANDCGALKTAHAGISLSQAEASVASPFTSKTGQH